jgi:hypothetical protein
MRGQAQASPDPMRREVGVAVGARSGTLVGVVTLLLAVLLVGCGSKITQENFDKVQVGMSQDQVKAILGEPTESSSMSFGPLSRGAWVWKKNGTTITIQFANGKVLAKQFDHKAP